MIEIRPDQLEMFRALEHAAFGRRVLAYLSEAHPEVRRNTPDAELLSLVRRQTDVAASHGIVAEASVVQFIEFGLVFGEDFHRSWKHPEAERILALELDGSTKIAQLLEAARNGFAWKP